MTIRLYWIQMGNTYLNLCKHVVLLHFVHFEVYYSCVAQLFNFVMHGRQQQDACTNNLGGKTKKDVSGTFTMFLLDFLSTGFSRGIDQEREYGENHRFWLRQKPEYIEFHPKYNSSVITLWKKGDRAIIFDKKYMMTGSYFMIYRLTQKDSGRYIMRDTDLNELSSSTLDVKGENS